MLQSAVSATPKRDNGGMGTLEQALQQLQEAGKPVEMSWLWDGGVEVNAGGEERVFSAVSEVLPWLQHWYGLGRVAHPDSPAEELQKIYDSEINIIRTGDKRIFVGLGNSFTGFEPHGWVSSASGILPWLQKAIHRHIPMSKYDVERLGRIFTPKMVEIP